MDERCTLHRLLQRVHHKITPGYGVCVYVGCVLQPVNFARAIPLPIQAAECCTLEVRCMGVEDSLRHKAALFQRPRRCGRRSVQLLANNQRVGYGPALPVR